jgi:3-oxoacyl-[acyl-carrier-protein] synthase-3
MDGKEVFRFAVQVMGSAAVNALEKSGMGPQDVALFIPHQANIRIIDAARKRLGLPKEKVFVNLEQYGNTSCGSIPLALSEARDQGRFSTGDVVVVVGFGGGLSWGAVVLRWSGTGAQALAV